ncbi:hypothetical protein [Jiulongibacter sediminis]|jgi:hypothetical protein|uniref:hypothetical protein n=1 Tax=Jiulongibacter sediminis TaxID=1605367 RepID=UPI0026F08336|nr:hypothetical protein [Jiulongibacter sediminis]
MKKLTFLIALLFIGKSVFAQNSKYEETMNKLTTEMLNQPYDALLQPVANKMQRVAQAEADQWLPNYWVAYCYIQDSFKKIDPAEKDQMLDVAAEYLKKAESIAAKPVSDIELLKAQHASAKMTVDPQNRWQEYGPKYQTSLNKAEQIDPSNPRVAYLKGTSAFYTPEAFGGGKKIAKPFFEEALVKFSNFTAETTYHPNWGKMESEYFITQCN